MKRLLALAERNHSPTDTAASGMTQMAHAREGAMSVLMTYTRADLPAAATTNALEDTVASEDIALRMFLPTTDRTSVRLTHWMKQDQMMIYIAAMDIAHMTNTSANPVNRILRSSIATVRICVRKIVVAMISNKLVYVVMAFVK
jgi:hypothetical protein